MKHYYLVLAGLLLPFLSSAQSNFKPGYILNTNGDTIKGSIDYREWDKNPKSINFKNSAGKMEVFTAKNSAGFGVTGQEYYHSATVSVSHNQVSILNIQAVKDTSVTVETVYLRTLTTGKNVTLYNYVDDIKPRFYVEEGGTTPQELIYETNYKPEDASAVQYNYRYRIQLQNIAQKYGTSTPKSDERIENAAYNKTDLIKIVQLINNNTTVVTAEGQGGSRFFAGLSANYNRLNFYDNKYTSSTFPEITAGFDFFLNKNTQSVFFRIPLSYTADKFTGSYDSGTNSPNVTKHTSIVVKQGFITFNPQVVYNFYNAEDAKAFVGVGIALRYSLSNTYTVADTYTNNASPAGFADDKDALHKFWTSVPTIKAGVAINKMLEIYVGYALPSEISSTGLSQKVTIYQAGLNYYFGKK